MTKIEINYKMMFHLSELMDENLELIEISMRDAKTFLDKGFYGSAELCFARVDKLREQFHLYEKYFNELKEETYQLIKAEEKEGLPS